MWQEDLDWTNPRRKCNLHRLGMRLRGLCSYALWRSSFAAAAQGRLQPPGNGRRVYFDGHICFDDGTCRFDHAVANSFIQGFCEGDHPDNFNYFMRNLISCLRDDNSTDGNEQLAILPTALGRVLTSNMRLQLYLSMNLQMRCTYLLNKSMVSNSEQLSIAWRLFMHATPTKNRPRKAGLNYRSTYGRSLTRSTSTPPRMLLG